MKRSDFIRKTLVLSLGFSGLTGMPFTFAALKKRISEQQGEQESSAGIPGKKLEESFSQLLKWMKNNGWSRYLKRELGLDLDLPAKNMKQELLKELDRDKLARLKSKPNSGYDDFSGEQAIQPGFPSFSLLFHTLASPRVRPAEVTSYPTLEQLDLLENYIYALADWEQLKSIYRIDADEELVLAVFAYEYRPAFKTPHHSYADMVYARTGIARIGSRPLHYDKLNRCFVNNPSDKQFEKEAAVMPARYGLFLAKKVKKEELSLITEPVHKGDDAKDDRNDDDHCFLLPVRKIFNDDVLTGNAQISFSEKHVSEKLQKLTKMEGIKTWNDLKPSKRYSADLIVHDKKLTHHGSSFLVISQHAPLIRLAKENGKVLFFQVPKQTDDPYLNRYFTAYCTQEVEDVELLEGFERIGRIYNPYKKPRNRPLFVNITNERNSDTSFVTLPKTPDAGFEEKLKNGDFFAPLFEDSICDGSVTADINQLTFDKIGNVSLNCLPAFSVVTAPDFFPQVDPLDFAAYDIAPGTSEESHFYEGGVASLATARIVPNPKMINSKNDTTRKTYLAVISGPQKGDIDKTEAAIAKYKNPSSERGYEISGFLPDVASSVFAPGWDVTYCSLDHAEDIYIGTEGLGSPFIEDMKFCSALNGMWPATSPDAARTYQGSNEAKYRNPTAVPLMDDEIGICGSGPAGKANECFGWDGEQGPYLEKKNGVWTINFTDLGRADAVSNALAGKIDLSRLRKLKSAELINRMECLKICIHNLEQRNFRADVYKARITGYTYLWLISAEKVNWGRENVPALGIPANLHGQDKRWITEKANAKIQGEGYLYVFANSVEDEAAEDLPLVNHNWARDLKRRNLNCEQIYVCQVTHDPAAAHKIAWAEIAEGKPIEWHVK